MATPAPAPTPSAPDSNDGIYELAPEPAPEPEPEPEPTPTRAVTVVTPDAALTANATAPAAPTPTPTPPSAGAEQPADPEAEKAEQEARAKQEKEAARARTRNRRRRRARRLALPAWAVSLVVHVLVLGSLALATITGDAGRKLVASINSALVPTSTQSEPDPAPIYADPTTQRSDQAVGNESAELVGGAGGGGGFGAVGGGPPSATPALSRVARAGDGRGGTGLDGLKIAANLSGLSMVPAAPGQDLGGTGGIGGDIHRPTADVGASLDQIAYEILRQLKQHKLTVVWLFDESESMKDDQKAIKSKFDRVIRELKLHADVQAKKAAEPLTHAVISFGSDIHSIVEKPTSDIEAIGRAIDKIPVDESGTENTLHALSEVIASYGGQIRKDRRLLIVLITDESGDDGGYIEEAYQAVVARNVPIYVIGRQSMFGYAQTRIRYVDPVTKDVYWPTIHRGPETADVELLQWDGLHDRWDEQPAGFPPYELARLTKASGGIYFLLPSVENMRVLQRESAYHGAELKEYVPDYRGRAAYVADRNRSELRRTLYEVIQATRWRDAPQGPAFYTRLFPTDPAEMIPAAQLASALATERLNLLIKIQERLESLQKQRDREPEKRWQAHYDLILAQVVAYQVKSFEYRACVEELIKTRPKPKKPPGPDQVVMWELNHSKDRKAPKERTEKKYAEALRLLNEVKIRHPNTPWADLAQGEIDRGFGVRRDEWHRNPKYDERMKMVPKY
jgi:hypothetical protein